MPYNSLISRTDVDALIPEEVSRDMLGKATEESAVLQSFRRIPVGRNQVRFPILSALPIAYWVNGDTGLKQTTEMAWTNKFMTIEELATIIPVPEAVVDDMDSNIWTEAEPYVREAFNDALDAAVFFGTNAPASFPDEIVTAAIAAGNTTTEGSTAANGGYYNDFDLALEKLEDDGFDLTTVVGARSLRGKLRRARNTLGDRSDPGRTNSTLTDIDGSPIVYPLRGKWPTAAGSTRAILLDAPEFVVGVRQDISLKVLTESVITDNTGAVIYNLPQQDMIALRVKFRVGWQVSNRINNDQPTEANRYPASVLRLP